MYNLKDKKLTITFPEEFRNKIWADRYGDLYKILRKNEIDKIEISLHNCFWIDPLPLLSILIAIKQYTSLAKENVSFLLPYNTGFKNQKLIKFLYSEGFINAFQAIGTLIDIDYELQELSISNDLEKSILNKENVIINDYEKIEVPLSYFDCSLLPITIINLKSESIIDGIVENVLSTISANLKSKKLNDKQSSNVLYKLKMFVNETLHNIHKHAYIGWPTKERYGGLYIRFRHGLENTSINSFQRKELSNSLYKEQELALFDPFFLETKEGCIEVFIADVGDGLAKTLKLKRGRDAFKNIFEMGAKCERSKKGNYTQFGGLHLIGQILNLDQDYLLGKDNYDWVGGLFPSWKKSSYYLSTENQETEQTPGCIWLARISWKISEERKIENWHYIKKNEEIETALEVYKSPSTDSNILNGILRIDERFKEFSDLKKDIEEFTKGKTCESIFYLPFRGMTKHKLINFLFYAATNIVEITSKTLIIFDIPEEELLTYTASLKKIRLSSKKGILAKINNIVLFSIRLTVSSFISNGQTFIVKNINSINELFNKRDQLSFQHLLKLLTTHDSLFFWQTLKENSNNRLLYINEEIDWPDENTRLNGYLNFPEACSIINIHKLFHISIERIVGLFNNEHPLIASMDVLTDNTIQLIRNNLISSNGNFIIYFGSIYVTGAKEKDTLSIQENKNISFHFFRHSNSKENIYKLLFWADQSFINKNFHRENKVKYKRLGRTPNISKDGWKSYLIPRYNQKEVSIYYMNPKQSFEEWQSLNHEFVKIGNFQYGNYNDLFKFDIKSLLEYGFHFENELFLFLFKYFFLALGGKYKEQLAEVNRERYWGFISEDILKINNGTHPEQDYFNDISVIVYPNHFNSSYAIERLKEIIVDPELTNRIFPLMPISIQRSTSSILFSSLNFTQIQNKLKNKDALIFDDSIVDGRTRKEIKHLLFSLGAKEVKTISIIDRQRLPYGISNELKHKAFWRLDIPRLGNKKSNPINRVLNSVKFKNETLTHTAKSRTKYWEKIWGPVNPFNDFSSHGLSSTPIYLKNPIKKYSIKEDPKDSGRYRQIGEIDNNSSRIHIKTSTGLSIYTTEINSLTGQNDLGYNYCIKEENNISPSAKIEILSSNLLLFGDEMSNELRQDYIRELFFSANTLESEDNHTALAAITLLSQEEIFQKKLLLEIERKSEFDANNNFNINCRNIDLRIFLAFSCYLLPESQKFKHFKRLLIEIDIQKEKSDRLWFNYELFEKRNSHISPINAVINEKGELKARFVELRYSFDKVIEILEGFPQYAFNNGDNENISTIIKQASTTTNLLLKQVDAGESEFLENKMTIQNSLQNEILPQLFKIHNNLFFKITKIDSDKESIYFILHKILEGISLKRWSDIAEEKNINFFKNEMPIIEFSNKSFAISRQLKNIKYSSWISWDIHIKKHIENIIKNALHCLPQKVISPWESLNLNETAHMWIDINVDNISKPSILNLTFANPIYKTDTSTLLRKCKNSSKLEKQHCDSLSIITNYKCNKEKTILFTTITFPII